MAKINPCDCEVWDKSTKSRHGKSRYPYINKGEKTLSARRFFYEHTVGEILDDDILVITLCGNTLCVNPEHLELKFRSRGQTCGNGHRLTEENVIIEKTGRRVCKECRKKRQRAAYQKKREYYLIKSRAYKVAKKNGSR